MDEMIESIRVAVATGATAEQKARGAQACQAIMVALGAEPGKLIVLPGAPAPHPLAGMPAGQALDLLIAKISAALPPESAAKEPAPLATPQEGIRIAAVPAPPRSRPTVARSNPARPARGRS